jgi:hypothetical protein
VRERVESLFSMDDVSALLRGMSSLVGTLPRTAVDRVLKTEATRAIAGCLIRTSFTSASKVRAIIQPT